MEIESDRTEIVDERRQTIMPPPVAPVAEVMPVTQVAPVAQAAPVAEVVQVAPVATVVEAPLGSETVLTSRTMGFTPAALVAALVAILFLIVGGITVARAGFDGSLDEPVVTVAGYTATALLGLIEIAFGLLLLIAALSRSRAAIMFFGITGGVMALVAVFQPSVGEGSLALERGFSVAVAILMGIVVLAALLPDVRRRSTVQRTTDAI